MEEEPLKRERDEFHGEWKQGVRPWSIPAVIDKCRREHAEAVDPDDR